MGLKALIVGPKSADPRTFDLWLQDGFGDGWTHFFFQIKNTNALIT